MSYWDSSSGQGTGSSSDRSNGRRDSNSSPGYYTGNSSSTTNTWGSNASDRFGMNSGSSNSFDLGPDLSRNRSRPQSNQSRYQNNHIAGRQSRSGSDSSTPHSPGGSIYYNEPSTSSTTSSSDSSSSSSSNDTRSFHRPIYGPSPDGTFGNPTDIFSNEPRPLGKYNIAFLVFNIYRFFWSIIVYLYYTNPHFRSLSTN